MIIIADHGNCDNAINPNGTPNTAHSLNPVPCIYVTNNQWRADGTRVELKPGRLADVAPTILQIMVIPQHKEMNGTPLIIK